MLCFAYKSLMVAVQLIRYWLRLPQYSLPINLFTTACNVLQTRQSPFANADARSSPPLQLERTGEQSLNHSVLLALVLLLKRKLERPRH